MRCSRPDPTLTFFGQLVSAAVLCLQTDAPLGGVQRLAVKDPMTYTPTVDDIDKRIKILLTPVRVDGIRGPTYQHILEPLRMPPQTAVFASAGGLLLC